MWLFVFLAMAAPHTWDADTRGMIATQRTDDTRGYVVTTDFHIVPAGFWVEWRNGLQAPATIEPAKRKAIELNAEIQQYVRAHANLALIEQNKFHIPASITLAQGILEGKYGHSKFAMKYNNHFGIKCFLKHKHGHGACVKSQDSDGKCNYMVFRNTWECYRYRSKKLATMTRYSSLFHLEKADYKSWCYGLSAAGYARDKNYAGKLINLIETYRLDTIQ